MVEYSKVNCKLTNVQLNKFKKAVKFNEGVTLRLGIRNFNKDERPHKLVTTRQNTKLRNAVNNNSATDIKLSKTQIKKIIQSGGFLGKLLSKLAGPLMKVAMPLAKNVLAPLGLTAAMSAIDGSIQKKIHGSGVSKLAGPLSMLLDTLGASLLGNLLSCGKGIMRAGEGSVARRTKGDGIVRAGESGSKKKKTKFTVTFSSINKYRNK